MSAPAFTAGDGVRRKDGSGTGTVVAVSEAGDRVYVTFGVDSAAEPEEVFPSQIDHLVPSDTSGKTSTNIREDDGAVCSITGGRSWPYEPTTKDREQYAQRGEIGWQKGWRVGCGSWCCYSFECAHITCDECRRSAVWPVCPDCGVVVRNPGEDGVCRGNPAAGKRGACTFQLKRLEMPFRYVCTKQVSVRCGVNGEFELSPTFCAVICERCFEKGEFFHEHREFMRIGPDGTHGQPFLVSSDTALRQALEGAATWSRALLTLRTEGMDLPRRPEVPAGAGGEQELASALQWRSALAAFSRQVPEFVPVRTAVASDEDLEDCVSLCEIEEGEEYVRPFPCDHVFEPATFAQLMAIAADREETRSLSCPGCQEVPK
jgi:hypothetical protein